MNIAILGSGKIGGTLGKKWAGAGHTIIFGVRHPDKPEVQELIKSLGGSASATSVEDAINLGEVVVFAVPGAAMDETITEHAQVLDGKTVIDATNNMGASKVNSLATFTEKTPQVKYFRAFNNYGWENFANPSTDGDAGSLFYCGVDGMLRDSIEQLIEEVGLEPVYVGGPEQVDVVDSVLRLWFTLVSGQKHSRHMTFKMMM